MSDDDLPAWKKPPRRSGAALLWCSTAARSGGRRAARAPPWLPHSGCPTASGMRPQSTSFGGPAGRRESRRLPNLGPISRSCVKRNVQRWRTPSSLGARAGRRRCPLPLSFPHEGDALRRMHLREAVALARPEGRASEARRVARTRKLRASRRVDGRFIAASKRCPRRRSRPKRRRDGAHRHPRMAVSSLCSIALTPGCNAEGPSRRRRR